MCAGCAHLHVCKYKEKFLAAQKAVDDLSFSFGRDKDGNITIAKLRDIEWIRQTKLVCANFIEKCPNGQLLTNIYRKE